MSDSELKSLFIAATVASAAIAFVQSMISTKRRFGGTYAEVMLWGWGQILMVLIPLFIYSIVAWAAGGWSKIIQSAEVAMAAATIFLMASQEMGCAVALERNYPVNRPRVAALSKWNLIFLCLSVVTVVLAFEATQLSALAVAWQFLLLVLAVLTYFSTAVVIRLIEVGYVPKRRT